MIRNGPSSKTLSGTEDPRVVVLNAMPGTPREIAQKLDGNEPAARFHIMWLLRNGYATRTKQPPQGRVGARGWCYYKTDKALEPRTGGICAVCGVDKPAMQFHWGREGRSRVCITCPAREVQEEATRQKEHARRAKGTGRRTEDEREYTAVLRCDPCSYCGSHLRTLPDHIEPLSKNGEHRWDNLTAACPSCNATKGTKTLLGFLLVQMSKSHRPTEILAER